MARLHPLSGVYAAAVTPLQSDDSLDLDSIPQLLNFFARRGCHGALLLGTTGEGPSFSAAERTTLFRTVVKFKESNADFRLLAGTGTPSLSETIDLTQTAFDLGYDGVVVLPPYYFRKATDEGLFKFFVELIHKAVPSDGYLLGYHFPDVAGIGFSIELLTRLKETFPAQFAGIKDSSHDANLAHRLGDRFGDDLLVLNGTDSYLQLAMENHAGGCITAPANLISPDLRALYDAALDGKDTAAMQARISAQRHILEKYMPFPPILKALLAKLHNLPRWATRPPLMDAPETLVAKAIEELSALESPA
jgi:4-hydroxy-tetrahydrodipicolinate synthase